MTVATQDIPADELESSLSESQWHMVIRRFQHHRMAIISLVLLILIFLTSVFAPILAPFPEDRSRDALDRRFLTPMSVDSQGKLHILGTDNLGRDYLTRLMFAARVSLTVAVAVTTCSSLIGIVLGLLAGYFAGWVDMLISRFLEFVSTFPFFVILLILMAIFLKNPALISLPESFVTIMTYILAISKGEATKVTIVVIVLSLLMWTGTARLMRGMVLSVREQQYIESSRALGASHARIIAKHIFPNAFPPLIVDYTLGLNNILVTEAALSFLGFGVQDPTPTWGNMLAFAQSHMFQHPWMPIIPGLPILIVSLAVNYIGDGLRDALDPRLKM